MGTNTLKIFEFCLCIKNDYSRYLNVNLINKYAELVSKELPKYIQINVY